MSKKRNNISAPEETELTALSRISHSLDLLVKLSIEAVRGTRSQAQTIVMLDSMGCGQTEIARLLGTTANTVNVTLYNEKKKTKK